MNYQLSNNPISFFSTYWTNLIWVHSRPSIELELFIELHAQLCCNVMKRRKCERVQYRQAISQDWVPSYNTILRKKFFTSNWDRTNEIKNCGRFFGEKLHPLCRLKICLVILVCHYLRGKHVHETVLVSAENIPVWLHVKLVYFCREILKSPQFKWKPTTIRLHVTT